MQIVCYIMLPIFVWSIWKETDNLIRFSWNYGWNYVHKILFILGMTEVAATYLVTFVLSVASVYLPDFYQSDTKHVDNWGTDKNAFSRNTPTPALDVRKYNRRRAKLYNEVHIFSMLHNALYRELALIIIMRRVVVFVVQWWIVECHVWQAKNG